MLKTRIQICIVYSISYLFAIKEKTDYQINTVSDRFHPYMSQSVTAMGDDKLGVWVKGKGDN
jgi:hypothetical protein